MDTYMKDSVNTLFRQRFQGHEAPVDPGIWTGIQYQLAASSASDGVNELFRKRFEGHQVTVDPAVWSTISGRLGHTASTGVSLGTWGWIGAGAAAVALTLALVVGPDSSQPSLARIAPNEAVVATPVDVVRPTIESARVDDPSASLRPVAEEQAPIEVHKPVPAQKSIPERTIATEAANISERAEPLPTIVDPYMDRGTGNTLVSAIITDLEEQVKQQPITASPEPSLPAAKHDVVETPVVVEAETLSEPRHAEVTPMPKLFMPNTFTPNGDGVNDSYSVDGEGYGVILLRVYSMKSNALVFTSNSGEPWTGDGCEDGMYMVAVEAHSLDGRTMTEGKVVWLNRNRIN